jgi:phage terminase large subunit-like protein
MLPKRKARSPGRFDKDRAQRAVRFIESLPNIKGRWAGENLKLQPWQQAVIEDVFGTLNPDGTRQYRTVYMEIPRKNGKTTLAAALALYLLFADNEAGAEVYSVAYDRDQASIAFDIAKEMVKQTPELRKRARIRDYKKRMDFGSSFYRAVEREALGQHGFNVHGLIFDELHTQRTPELWDVLTSGKGSRTQPLIFAITTAGYDRESICWKQHDRARKILKGVIESPTFYPVIFSAVDDDALESEVDWLAERVWYKCNPGLDTIIDLEEMREAAQEARDIPAQQNTFKRLRENIWTQAESRLIDGEKWAQCAGGMGEDELGGGLAFGGLDLASTIDIAAFALAFPVDGKIETLYRFWCPRETIQKRTHDDGVPYQSWVDRGYMRATEGSAIDYDSIEAEILSLAKRYNIRRINYDRWQAVQMAQHLEAEGLEMAAMGTGYKSMSEPTKQFQRLILDGKLRHTGHPVMRWMIDNLVGETDASENVKPSKKKSTEKIDGCVALIMALDGLIRGMPEQPKSVYEERGPLVLEV